MNLRTIRGTVTAVHRRTNQLGALWAEIELNAGVRVLVFPKCYAHGREHLVVGADVEITARPDGKNLFAHSIAPA